MVLFKDRTDAGQILAQKLSDYRDRKDILVLALPRGGVPMALEIAKALHAPMDIFMVQKLGLPGRKDLAMGAIASGGVQVVNEELVAAMDIPEPIVESVARREQRELARREQAFREGRPDIDVRGKAVILTDEGLSTGSSMRAAIASLRAHAPEKIIVAVPVAPLETRARIEQEVDEIICAATPEPFFGVGEWYEKFEQTTDEEVCALLKQAPTTSAKGCAADLSDVAEARK